MNYYKTSDGNRISKAVIDRRVREAKKIKLQDQLNGYGYNFCTECAENGRPESANQMELSILDCAHIIPVDECQKTGISELAWALYNIDIKCRFHHKRKDRLDLKFKLND
jgi:hypothetical protein